MKADWNDAPDYITRHPRRSRRLGKLIPGLIGTVITLAVLHMAGSAFLQGTAQSIAEKRIQPKPDPMAEVSRAESAASKDWDRVVDEVALRDATSEQVSVQTDLAGKQITKQTVFTDANYTRRGADNVLTLEVPKLAIPHPKPAANKEIVIVGQRPSMKDRVCWPHKEGSIQSRNCRSSVGLRYRD